MGEESEFQRQKQLIRGHRASEEKNQASYT